MNVLQRLTLAIDDAMSQVVGVSCQRCRKPACCRDAVFVHRDEVAAIVRYIKASPRRNALTIRVRQYVAQANDATRAIAKWSSLDKTDDAYAGELKAFQASAKPCPLLSDRGMCSVYPVRPFACRTHVSFDDPEACERLMKGGGPITSISIVSFLPILLSEPGFVGIIRNLDKFLPFALHEALFEKPAGEDE